MRIGLRIAALAGAAVVGAVATAELLFPPALTASSLESSLKSEIGSFGLPEDGECAERRPGAWHCDVPDQSGSGGVASYSVAVTSQNCWQAHRTKLNGERAPRTASGCLHWGPW